MLFNSFIFWVFFAIVLLIYFRINHKRQNYLLLVASYVFYGWWDWRFLSLILISTCVDYFVSNALNRTNIPVKRKLLLLISIIVNLGMLGFFKYYNFFVTEFSQLVSLLGFHPNIHTFKILLPVGISFYTFQTLGYTIDVYRRDVKPVRDFFDFALFVSFFPQLVAGPIERFNRLMPQIQKPRPRQLANWTEGGYHILIGLFKKIVIADNMAAIVNAIFAGKGGQFTGPEYFMGVLAFTFQIYGDFSGYSSIAQGVAKIMGFDICYNFKMPYFSASPGEFWRRWHITLSTWLRDYLYITLGGNRRTKLLTSRNLLLTMLLGGLWHGAGWAFICWGLYHGILLCIYRPFEKFLRIKTGISKAFLIVVMFLFTMAGWCLFRSETIQQAGAIFMRIFTNCEFTDFSIYMLGMILFFAGPLMIYEFILYRKRDDMLWLLDRPWFVRACVYCYFALMLLAFYPGGVHEFIYFQF